MCRLLILYVLFFLPLIASGQSSEWIMDFYNKNGRPPSIKEMGDRRKYKDSIFIAPIKHTVEECSKDLDSITTEAKKYIETNIATRNYSYRTLMDYVDVLYTIDRRDALVFLINHIDYSRRLSGDAEDIKHYPILKFVQENNTKTQIIQAVPMTTVYNSCENVKKTKRITYYLTWPYSLLFYHDAKHQRLLKALIEVTKEDKDNTCLVNNLRELSRAIKKSPSYPR